MSVGKSFQIHGPAHLIANIRVLFRTALYSSLIKKTNGISVYAVELTMHFDGCVLCVINVPPTVVIAIVCFYIENNCLLNVF